MQEQSVDQLVDKLERRYARRRRAGEALSLLVLALFTQAGAENVRTAFNSVNPPDTLLHD